jgi:uncharacterized protein (TIGR02594 family)
MATADRELLKIKTKIGNSFLRAFYPIDYRSNQNILKNVDDLLEREVRGLRALSSTTSQVSQKIGRALTSLSEEMDELRDSMNSLQSARAAREDGISNTSKSAEDVSNALIDFLAAGGFEALRRLKNRTGGRAPGNNRTLSNAEKEAARRAKIDKWREERAGGKAPKEAKAPDSKYKLPKGLGILGLAIGLWGIWSELQALDPNMKKGEYRQAVTQIVARAVASFGLMWVGAFLGAMVGGALGFGVGALPGFIAGLVGGAVADYALGDSVDELVNGVVDYLYTGDEEEEAASTQATPDATIQMKEPPAPVAALEPVPQQSSEQASVQAMLAPPIAGPTPPTPPAEQMVDSPVEYPGPVSAVDLEPFAKPQTPPTTANAAVNEALNRVRLTVPQTEQEQSQYMQDLYGGGEQAPAGPLPPPTGDLLSTASQYLGMSEGKDRSTLNAFIGQYFQPWDVAKTPWCAAFTNSVLASNQLPGTGSAWAKSFLDYGVPVWSREGGGDVSAVQPGDIAVFTRGGGGHVGFVKSFTGDSIVVLGGNQSDSSGGGGAVTESSRGTQSLLKIVRPAAMAEGGKIEPKKGGTLALVAEAGEPEYVVPQSKAIKFAHEMLSARPQYKTKRHTHVVVMPILT